MVGSVRYPVVNPDFAPFLARAKDVKPDVMYIFCISGKQSTAIMKTMADLGMRTAGIHPVSGIDLTTDEELPNMGDIALGVNSASNYSAAGDRPQNKAFLAAWNAITATNSCRIPSRSKAGTGWRRSMTS